MKIASSALQMESQHSEQQSHLVRSAQRAWIADSAAANEGNTATIPASATVQISAAGSAAQSSEVDAIQQSVDDVENDPTLRMIRSLVAILTGKDITELSSNALHFRSTVSSAQLVSQSTQIAPQTADAGIEYIRQESYSESEQTDFSASGVINTADGQQLNFSLTLSMTRSYHEESSSRIRFAPPRPTQDPLVLNFDGKAAQLTDQRFAFDLNADGNQESINFVTGGSGFLAIDRNGNGRIDNGGELFGVASGNGFADLASLDSDQNGWIDENDAAYNDLRLWTRDASGADRLSTLKEADVGAIALAHVATSFAVKDESNEQQGQIRSSGIFLRESGLPGTVQQVDLSV